MLSKKIDTERIFFVILVFIILIQIAALVVVGMQKNGYHNDEIFTYILSNSYDADRISHDRKVMDSWNEGSYLDKYVVVDENERFAYGAVKHNNSQDAHPPLYYYLIHTISSFVPGVYSKWIGLGLNFFLFAGIQSVLYFLVRDITGKKIYGVAAVALNGGLAATMDMMHQIVDASADLAHFEQCGCSSFSKVYIAN